MREKPKYSGRLLEENAKDWIGIKNEKELRRELRREIRIELRKLYPADTGDETFDWDPSVDAFVAELLTDARQAAGELFCMGEESTKGETRAELRDLLKSVGEARINLVAAEQNFRRLSPALDRCLDINTSPLDHAQRLLACIEIMTTTLDYLKQASPKVERLPQAEKNNQKEHGVIVEMTINVLRTLIKYGIPPSAYASESISGCQSGAVTILELIGKHINHDKEPTTWRETISEAKKQIPELRQ